MFGMCCVFLSGQTSFPIPCRRPESESLNYPETRALSLAIRSGSSRGDVLRQPWLTSAATPSRRRHDVLPGVQSRPVESTAVGRYVWCWCDYSGCPGSSLLPPLGDF